MGREDGYSTPADIWTESLRFSMQQAGENGVWKLCLILLVYAAIRDGSANALSLKEKDRERPRWFHHHRPHHH